MRLRMDDSLRYLLIWWDHGLNLEVSRQAVDRINKLHAYWEKRYPGDFRLNEDFIYVLCYFAAGLHLVRQRVGLIGYDEKMQRASWKFWSEMSKLFLLGGDGENLVDFPLDFNGILNFITKIESCGWTYNEHGPDLIDCAIVPFTERYFLRLLHGLGWALILGMVSDGKMRSLGMPPASRL
ncbi:hypothetical protein J3E72DRAFT_263940 [Bipolaris maydis]|nr:hypothetical protein J3E72DRAFT_263940 [Bipolaris maydis]